MGYLSMLLIITTVRFASATQFDSFNSTWTDGSPSSETSPLERISNVTLTVLRRCLDTSEAAGCLRQKMMKALDYAIRDNGTWRINDYVTFERNPEYEAEERMIAADTMGRADDPVDNTVSGKLSKLLRSRRVQMYTNLVPTVNEGEIRKNGLCIKIIKAFFRSQEKAQTRRRYVFRRHRHGRSLCPGGSW